MILAIIFCSSLVAILLLWFGFEMGVRSERDRNAAYQDYRRRIDEQDFEDLSEVWCTRGGHNFMGRGWQQTDFCPYCRDMVVIR